MITTGFETRIKVQQIIQSQLPEFVLEENPKFSDFLKQYYISQEYQGGPVDLVDNLDQYLKLYNLTPEVITGSTNTTSAVTSNDTTISVSSTKGFPEKYGLLKIDDEIITYTGITTNSFTGCIRGFSGVTNFHQDLNQEELVFEETSKASHANNSSVTNLSVLFLQEFYKKIKYSLTPGLEDSEFDPEINVGNFIREARSFYQAKGTEDSFKILFNVLFGITPKVVDLEEYLIKSSGASYVRREVALAENIKGDPSKLIGQTIKKQGDDTTSAAISEVEIVTREGKNYYKLLIFVGYDDSTSFITGDFSVTPTTRVTETVQSGASVISVDSTIGFPDSGSLFFDNDDTEYEIIYTNKSINQFFGCYSPGENNIDFQIPVSSVVRTGEIYYGFENGDQTKRVELRITGVLSDLLVSDDGNYDLIPGDEIYVKNLGDNIGLSPTNNTYKQILANSWIYNTSCRYQINSFPVSGNTLTTKSLIEKDSLSIGDTIEILLRNTQSPVTGFSNVQVVDIIGSNTLVINVSTNLLDQSQQYDLRRKLKKSTSSVTPLEFSNQILSDIQNTYSEGDEFLYVASNSLPSYDIETDIFKYSVDKLAVAGYDSELGKSYIIEFASEISFITGDRVVYNCTGEPIIGLENNESYYVEVIGDNLQIKLFNSASFVGTDQYVLMGDYTRTIPAGNHTFVLFSQKESVISPQKLLRKIKIQPDIGNQQKSLSIPGPVGMLVNGVEVISYKTNDKISYGPVESVRVLNGGEDYDVINPPKLQFSSGTAKIQPVLSGSVKKVLVDPQDFDVDVAISIAMTGGNGSGASFEPIIKTASREISFDARVFDLGGGVDINSETISFLSRHSLLDGQQIIYDNNGNSSIGISSIYQGSNASQGITLVNRGTYFVKVINDTTVRLHNTVLDALTGINTIGFTTTNTTGFHKFFTQPKKSLSEIRVLNGGSGYQNRKLTVKQSGISTQNYTINFNNHGFNTGDLVTYDYQTSPISGLSTSNRYYVQKVDNSSFRVCDAGIGGTSSVNYDRGNYVKFTSKGSGYQYFSYPPISLSVTYASLGIGTTAYRGVINATPVVKGSITDVYVYESGSDYGSTILNVNKLPIVNVKTGTTAQMRPTIVDGKIFSVQVQFGGVDYYSVPELEVVGEGTGAVLRAIISNNTITNVVVVNPGSGYLPDSTSIIVKSSGRNAKFDVNVRSLTVNSSYKYGIQEPLGYRGPANEALITSHNNLQYYVLGYNQSLSSYFDDDGTKHSPIIGWAYDGNPIYGPYGYEDPNDSNSPPKLLQPGYQIVNLENRPVGFTSGFFVEDYRYVGNGDLDEYNGRYCKTPDFPNGTYAYFASVQQNPSGDLVGKFPYFVGNYFRSKFSDIEILLDQSFDFNNSSLLRNTNPYKINDQYADNDFIVESNELIQQKTVIESVFPGKVNGFEIISAGDNYRINDELAFAVKNSSNDLVVSVSEITGRDITTIQRLSDYYNNVVLTWENEDSINISIKPNHNLIDGDKITISGVSTSLSSINGLYTVGVTTYVSTLSQQLADYSTTGEVTDIFVSGVPSNVSAGSSIKIGSEIMTILNTYSRLPISNGILRVKRYSGISTSHFESSQIYFLPDVATIFKKSDRFDSKINQKIFFNPQLTVGVGTTPGVTIDSTYSIGDSQFVVSIPTQSIYIPNHPFNTNDLVTISRPLGASEINYSNESNGSPTWSLFGVANSRQVYIINKSKDFIGIATNVGLTTTGGVFFLTSGGNDFQYSIESNYYQEAANITRNEALVSLGATHSLTDGDSIRLVVKPNTTVGIGTSVSVRVKFDTTKELLIVNPIRFGSSDVNVSNNTITLQSHGLKSGDKILYSSGGSASGGLTNKSVYYVRKVDNNIINLCESYLDSISAESEVIDITSSGGNSQEVALINPEISVVRNNNLVFNLSDSSLNGYKFKIYYDENFNKEFISVGSTTNFSISGVGTIGISTNATLTLKYSNTLPEKLFYNLEKSGYISTSDKEVKNSCQINFVNSEYTGNYKIYGISSDSFSVSLRDVPEKSSYNQSECDELKYFTDSKTDFGGISKIKIITSSDYKEVPKFTGNKKTDDGVGAYIIAKTNNIGKSKESRIISAGFDYASDKTLRPTALFPQIASIKSSYTIKNVNVLYGGNNYITTPDVLIIDSESRDLIETGDLRASLRGSSIELVSVQTSPKGLPSIPVEIRTKNNSNGISISQVQSSTSGIVTCLLSTPITGFSTDPFRVGDSVWVEGVIKVSSDGTGFNSSDYGYRFFTITNYYSNSNPGRLEYSLSGLTTNPGIAKTIQDAYASIIAYDNYPRFEVEQSHADFFVGEGIFADKGFGYEDTDLKITSSSENFVRLVGNYGIESGTIIKGKESNTVCTINEVKSSSGTFDIRSTKKENIGWENETGKLSEDSQVLSDNDYYQNLSYTIKSPKEWNEIVTPVNRLVHTSGLKNFADTEIIETTNFNVGVVTGQGIESDIDLINDFISESRVDTINYFQLVTDTDVSVGVTPQSSKFIKFDNFKLSDYFEVRTNRVLTIDDISSEFSSVEDASADFNTLKILNNDVILNRFLIQTIGTNESNEKKVQLSEIVSLNETLTLVNLYKGEIFTEGTRLGEYSPEYDELVSLRYLSFVQEDKFDTNYSIKYIHTEYRENSDYDVKNIGFVNLYSTKNEVSVGTTSNILSLDSSKFNSIYVNLAVVCKDVEELNYVELYITHDGTDSYYSELYFDTKDNETSQNFIGTFTSYLSGGLLKLDFYNNFIDDAIVVSKVVGFGTTSVGIGTYRFKLNGQSDGSERTVVYFSNYQNTVGLNTSTIITLNKDLFTSLKSTVTIGLGNTSVLHQVLLVHDGENIFTTQYPYLSTGETLGIGTFGGEYSGSDLLLRFYPDPGVSGTVSIRSFTEAFYTILDETNSPPVLTYGNVTESINITNVYGLNLDEINRRDFPLFYNSTPIFMKSVDPSDTSVFDISTGTFFVTNHFFSTGEELTYTPTSTFIGVGASAMGIVTAFDYLGITTNRLPSKVYAIKVTNDQFKIALRKSDADSGVGVTFTNRGSGNAHQFEMFKKNEKSLITLNNLVQYPLAYSAINYSLSENIGAGNTTIVLSGIASVNPTDILKIDNEYMIIRNVGLATTSVGPITFTGDYSLVEVERGSVGSSATTHTSSSSARIYRGSYNIEKNRIYFTNPPRGGGFYISDKNESYLTREKASFSGRVFLRKNYESNKIYDSITEQFTGIGATYTLTSQGINTVGLGTSGGNGILFINSVFQAPTTENNSNNNFAIIEVTAQGGITSVTFSGITDEDGDIIVSEYDVNENQLPRGGIIVSIGSTIGVGYAPLVGAYVTTILNGSGTIIGFSTNINYGSGYRGPVSVAVTDANHTGTAASITATVGAGGTLAFTIVNGGSGYVSPTVIVPPPVYENMEVEGTFRVGIGQTTETGTGLLLNLEVGYTDRDPLPISGRNADASRLIRANREVIAEESVGRMLAFYPGFAVPGGSQNCIDDIEIVLDAIAYNLEYGGNSKVYESGKIYIDNGYLAGEEEQSVYAYVQARDLAINAMRNIGIGVSKSATIGITTTQITGINTSGISTGRQVRSIPNVIQYDTTITSIGIGSIFISKPSLNTGSITTSITISQYSNLPQTFDTTIEGDISGSPGIYNSNDCSDVASAIGSFVGIVTNAIAFGTLPANKVGVAGSVFEITNFKIKRPGYGFRRGDKFRPVGLVTAKGLSSPIIPFELTVVDVYNDSFAAWQFGELNYIDSIRNYQDGQRTRFPLFYNGQLLSFETNSDDPDSQLIDFESLLVIFINGILQEPKKSYEFTGGTSFTFTVPPKAEDVVSVFFYLGTNGEDAVRVDVTETFKSGDQLQIFSNNSSLQETQTQDPRTIIDIIASDKLETNQYIGDGIDPNRVRPASWTKQKTDLFINNTIISKTRDSIETQVYPTATIIKDVSTSSNEIFVDNAEFFNYEEENPIVFGGIVLASSADPVSAGITAIVSAAGTIQSLVINNPGSGYIGSSFTIKISSPQRIGVGIGTTATATLTTSSGQVSSVNIVNPGFGYTFTAPPQVIVSTPDPQVEFISNIINPIGYSGVIVGIATTTGIGVPLALKFTLARDPLTFPYLTNGYPLYITDTRVGGGVTSVDTSNNSIVGVGTTCLDNIYYIHAFDPVTGIATCNIRSNTNVVGIATTGSFNAPVGRFSWGRLSGFTRSSNPVSIAVTGRTVTSGLSTYPTIQRRSFGLRNTGSLKKRISNV